VPAIAIALATAATPQNPPAAQNPAQPTMTVVPPSPQDPQKEDGTPILSEAVVKVCSQCHVQDEQKRMSRISYRRTTPEGWQETIKRMISLNSLTVEPQDAREVLKYLANHLGLAPEEARPAMFEAERRLIEYTYPDKDTEATCTRCHSIGRVMSQRRSKAEWDLLIAMHRGYYPFVDFQAFRRGERSMEEAEEEADPADKRQPYEKAIAHLSRTFPLKSSEWSAWSANMRPPKLEGRWAVNAYAPGAGPVYGEMVVKPAAGKDDEFTTEARLVYARSGRTTARTGRAIVYTGFQWRGRSTEGSDQTALRETMLVERDWMKMSGRWFTGAYDETGLDVTLERIGNDPVVLGAVPSALRLGGTSQQVHVFGAALPSSPAASDIDLGAGVRVSRVVSATPTDLVVEADVAASATPGSRDVFVAGRSRKAAITVYGSLDAISVTPRAGMARVGGANFQPGLQQFEARGVSYGADGKPDTVDDLNLGIIDAAWSLEELPATFKDDDTKFVGTIDKNGLFTPNVDGPNPARSGNRDNVGDVWVVASIAADEHLGARKPLRARAHLLVTVPLYMKWDQPEVAR
jgi:quinohemoprotein amine dehydrogenase